MFNNENHITLSGNIMKQHKYTWPNIYRISLDTTNTCNKITSLCEAIERSIEQKIVYDSLFYLNELELLGEAHCSHICEYERQLIPLYLGHCVERNLHSCKLCDYEVEKVYGSISEFYSKHAGDRCFIINAGDSLTVEQRACLGSEITFACDCAKNYLELLGFMPTYQVVDEMDVARLYKVGASLPKESVKFVPQYLANILPYSDKTIYFNMIPDYTPYTDFPFFGVDARHRVWSALNPSYTALQLAYYMGFTEVFLLDGGHDAQNSASLPLEQKELQAFAKAKYAYDLANKKIFSCAAMQGHDIFERKELAEILAKPVNATLNTERMPLISIIIPAYNAEDTLCHAVDSALNQLCETEIILVDDGSTDRTADVAAEYTARFSNVHYLHQENKGSGSACNAGMRHARGQFVTFLMANDTFDPQILDLALEKIISCDADILAFGHRHATSGNVEYESHTHAIPVCGIQAINRFFIQDGYPFALGRVYKSAYLKDNDIYFNENIIYADINFLIKAYYFSRNNDILHIPGYNIIDNERQKDYDIITKYISSACIDIKSINEFIIGNGIDKELQSGFIYFCYKTLKLLKNSIKKINNDNIYNQLLYYIFNFIEEFNLDMPDVMTKADKIKKGFAKSVLNNLLSDYNK